MSDTGAVTVDTSGSLGNALSGVTGMMAKELPGALAEDKADRAMMRDAARATIRQIDQGTRERGELKPPPLPPPQPPPQYQQTSMTDKWGSLAMGMAVLGSAMTRRPAVASLNAAAGVLNAYHDSDAEAYKRNFDHWKATSEYALKMYEYQRDAYKDAISNIKENTNDAMAKLRVVASAFGDDALKHITSLGNAAGAIAKIDEFNARLPMLRAETERAKVEGELVNRFNVARKALHENPNDPAALAEMQAIDAESKRLRAIPGGVGGAGSAEPKAGTAEDLLARRTADYKAANGGAEPPNALREQWTKEIHQLTSAGTQHAGVQHTYEITDKDGKVVRTVTAQTNPAGGLPIDINTGKPVAVDQAAGESIRAAPPGSEGRQQATQLTAIRGAGLQATAALKNLVELPISSNLGATMGVQFKTPDDMAAAIRRSAVRKLTGPEARKLQISFLGVGRNLATLEAQGRATGLVGLSDQMTALAPQVGDDPMVNLRIYAEIRQVIDQSIKNAIVSHKQTPELEALYGQILRDTHAAVPYTVHDVNELERDMSAKKGPRPERARDFAERVFANQGRPLPPPGEPATAGAAPSAPLPAEQPPTTGVAEGSLWKDGPGGKVIGVLRNGKWVAP